MDDRRVFLATRSYRYTRQPRLLNDKKVVPRQPKVGIYLCELDRANAADTVGVIIESACHLVVDNVVIPIMGETGRCRDMERASRQNPRLGKRGDHAMVEPDRVVLDRK